jgi:glycosyltransferase involved in cell wall biosynthesis
MKDTIVILGINEIQQKNVLQLEAGRELQFRFDALTNDTMKTSMKYAPYFRNMIILQSGFFNKIFSIILYFSKFRRSLHHAEIYTAGRLAFFYLLLTKIFRVPSIVVERGDIADFGSYPRSHRLSMALSYRYADVVWYREYYMKSAIERFRPRKLAFIPNATRNAYLSREQRDIDFLWVNRLVRQRMSSWFVDILKEKEFEGTNNYMLGFNEDSLDEVVRENQQYVRENCPANLTLLPFVDPTEYYKRAKYFVLPAEIVFANNSLLEAMSYGVVPIISNVEGASVLVPGKEVGYVVEHNRSCFRNSMLEALVSHDLDSKGKNAVEHISRNFSKASWQQKIKALYRSLD